MMYLKDDWIPFKFVKIRANKAPMERKNEIVKMRKSGKTYAEIGLVFGITRQRVHEILNGGKLQNDD